MLYDIETTVYKDGSIGCENDSEWCVFAGQCTGLFDKFGKEIYEGDICRTRDNSELLICDDFNDFIYMVLYSEDHGGLNGNTQKDLEIIGNIYDNEDF